MFRRRQAQAAIDAYRLSLELPGGGAAAYENCQAAVAEYEDLGCRTVLGPPAGLGAGGRPVPLGCLAVP